MEITQFIVTQREKALLIGDYGSYRRQLSRRLLVLRKKLDYTSRGRKYTPKAPVTVEDIARNHEFIHLLLLSAERAWALAMHMRTTQVPDSTSKGITGSTKRHVVSRLEKANGYANHLIGLLEEKEKSGASAESILEARAYQQSLKGAIKFEKRNWEQCLQSYSETRLLYMALAQSVGAKQDDLFKDLLSNTIDPSIRYAAYQSKLPRTISIETIVARYVPRADNRYVAEILASRPSLLQETDSAANKNTKGLQDNIPKTIQWRSRTVDLEDATTAQALVSMSTAKQKLVSFVGANKDADRRAKAAAYDDVLLPSQDAVDATKTAIDELTAEGVAQADPRVQSLQITRTAVNYNLVEWRVGRNRVLCGDQDGATFEDESRKPKKARADGKPHVSQEESDGRRLVRLKERVVLCDSTLQSLESVKSFPGVAADQGFMAELDSKKAYFSSLRCLAIARSHTLLGNRRNALALLARALDLSSRSQSDSTTAQSTDEGVIKLEVTAAQARSLHDLLERLVLRYRALIELADLDLARSKENPGYSPPLIERLDEYPSKPVDLTNLVTYPPKVQPVPVKPIFLDVAWNYIDYPGRPRKGAATAHNVKSKDAAPQTEQKKVAKKGWFGFGR